MCYSLYSQNSILRASILRGPPLYADFFQKVGTPKYFMCLSPIADAMSVLQICRLVRKTFIDYFNFKRLFKLKLLL
jgi:hypothetical protein